uniref:TOBE domain-containing protein n=1 Tax=Marinobacterium profundum TaxID=1714300 RepID=UPI000B064072
GSPLELYHHPVNQFVAGFIGTPKMAFLKGKVSAVSSSDVTVALECGPEYQLPHQSTNLKVGDDITMGIRPEHIEVVASDASPFKVRLDVTEHLGADTYCYIKLGNGEMMTVRAPGDFSADYGQNAALIPDLTQAHLFDADGKTIPRPRTQAKVA